jgi:hypothetical protein
MGYFPKNVLQNELLKWENVIYKTLYMGNFNIILLSILVELGTSCPGNAVFS